MGKDGSAVCEEDDRGQRCTVEFQSTVARVAVAVDQGEARAHGLLFMALGGVWGANTEMVVTEVVSRMDTLAAWAPSWWCWQVGLMEGGGCGWGRGMRMEAG